MAFLENGLREKPLIIFDTDMDTDCDDAGALALLLEYVKRGRAELLGIVADVVSPYAAACCEALGAFYGVSCPIGTVYASEYPVSETNRLVAYRRHSAAGTVYPKGASRRYLRGEGRPMRVTQSRSAGDL